MSRQNRRDFNLFALISINLAMACALGGSSVQAATLAFEHAVVIDGTGAPPRPGTTVVVDGPRIAALGSDGEVPVPRGARRIDATGKYLIPGLMDLHLHLIGGGAWKDSSAQSGKALDFDAGISALHGYLYYGFTSIYDAGNNPDFILPLRDRERAGRIVSPRIFATGQLLSYPGSWSVGYAGIAVRDWPETIKGLDLQLGRKPNLQKLTYESHGVGPNPLIPALPKELMAQAIDYLHQRGVRVTVHIHNEVMARDAIAAGADTLAHAPSSGVISQDFARLVAEKRIPIQTTLSVFDEISNMDQGVEFLKTPEFAATVSAAEIPAREKSRTRYVSLEWPGWFRTILPYAKRNLKMIHDAGGIVALGSDRTFAPNGLRELELVVESGISPADTIKIATYNAAFFLGRDKELGSIAPGKLADLVLLNADPTVDIRNVKAIELVVKNGAIVDRARLDLPINRQPKRN
jgi:imidazolonepropionase-like amidohydrolase